MQINNYISILKREFKGYNLSSFGKDCLAGITCTAVALPLALAFGVSAGADAASGLICAILAGIIIGGLSGASYQISGPTGAMAAILISLSVTYGLQGVYAAGFLSGVILLLFAFFKAGRLVYFIPKPVITGFTSGIAVTIALGQIDNAFGTHSAGTSAIGKLLSYAEVGFQPVLMAVVFTLIAMLIMILWPKRFNAVFPGSLLAIIVALVIQMVFRFEVATVGAIPRTLLPEVRLQFSSLNPAYLSKFISPAISIALLGTIESLLCGASGGKMKGEKIDATQELYAQGIGNAVIPFFGGIPATAAIARTSVAIKSGGVTRMTSIIHSIGLLLSMFLLGPFMAQIPLAALAGVLFVTSWRMNEWSAIRNMFSGRLKTSIAQFLITMIATVVFDLTVAILIGVGLSMILFVLRARSEMRIQVEDPEFDEITRVVYIDGSLFFATQERITATVNELKGQGVKRIIFSLRGVPTIDHSEIEELEGVFSDCKKDGIEYYICGLQDEVAHMFARLGVDKHFEGRTYTSVVSAIDALKTK